MCLDTQNHKDGHWKIRAWTAGEVPATMEQPDLRKELKALQAQGGLPGLFPAGKWESKLRVPRALSQGRAGEGLGSWESCGSGKAPQGPSTTGLSPLGISNSSASGATSSPEGRIFAPFESDRVYFPPVEQKDTRSQDETSNSMLEAEQINKRKLFGHDLKGLCIQEEIK